MLEYKNQLKSSGRKASTINQTMSALRKVFKVLTEFGYLKQNPFKVSVIRAEKVDTATSKGALQVSQLNAMMEANKVMRYDGRTATLLRCRNGLVLKFLYLTAARRGEAADLRWDDIVQDGAFYVAVLRFTKSGKEQRIKLRDELHEELSSWRLLCQQNSIDSAYVFPSLGFRTLAHQMSGKGINDIVSRLGKAIGLNISAHYLRHTAITLALELGEPLQKVQSYARHASANTTIRYFHDRQLLEKNPTDRLPLI
jgi:integrase